ncbi:hypothetical protein MMC25_000667 [Agyrium rufum]|nr:hypothetical protein [Agyrium rufum]
MVYLTYIIDHYDNISDTTLFFHHHRWAWHNNILLGTDTANTIRRLSDERVARIHPDRPEIDYDIYKKPEEQHFTRKVWQELFPFERVPPAISQPCCAQFAVSRDRIRATPRSMYIHYRDWLLNTPLDDANAGRVMEYSWHYIFSRNAELCPAMNTCYCDGYGICCGGAVKLKAWLGKQLEREAADDTLRKWDEAEANPDKQAVLPENHQDWRDRSTRLRDELDATRDEAYKRGDDPKNRALEVGRPS